MPTKKILVSIVIPTFNSANTIIRAVKSIQNQTYQNWELIIVDDGSTDNTLDLIYSQINGKNIKVVSQPNLGAGVARNNGVKHARGEYIAFLDADDEWFPWKLELQLEVTASVKEFGIISTGNQEIHSGETITYRFQNNRTALEKLITYDIYDLLNKCYCLTSSVLIPREVFINSTGFNSKWRTGQDRDLWTRIAYRYPIYHIPNVLVNYYVDPKSLSRRLKFTNLVNRLLINEQFWPGAPNSMDVEGKIDPQKYFKIFRAKLRLVEKLIIAQEPLLAKAIWERFGKVFGHSENIVYGIVKLKSDLRQIGKKKRTTVDNIPELIRLLKIDNSGR